MNLSVLKQHAICATWCSAIVIDGLDSAFLFYLECILYSM